MSENIHILSTMPLDKVFLTAAMARNIWIDAWAFITTVPLVSKALHKRLAEMSGKSITVIFTSQNAVKAVADLTDCTRSAWKVFCLEGGTFEMVKNRFPEATILGVAADASELAEIIIAAENRTVFFFCGNLRRDELPLKLQAADILVDEVIVYETHATARQVAKAYQGILFSSPSAVESFFSMNTIDDSTILFAIGITTADSIGRFSNNTIITCDKAGKEALVELAMQYFDH